MAYILVIDDDPSLLQMMQLMLKRAGHEVVQASGGHDGIQIAKQEQPDLAIVDVMMPDMNGLEVCTALRSDQLTAHIPLLVLTALSQPEQREAATIAGADDFMTKPVTRDALNEHVTKLLQSGPTSKVAPPTPVKEPSPPPANQSSARAQAPTGSSVIVIMGLQVGVGSTTLAVNMALSLMQHGRTCVIDLNQQGGQVAVHFGMTPPHSTWQHLVGAQPGTDKRMIGSALMMDPHSHLAIMAAPMTPATQRFAVDSFGYVVTVIMEGFHHVVIDLPPSLDEMAQAVLKNAHHVVLVADNDPAKIPLCAEMIRQVQRMDLRGQTHVVLNNSRLQGIPSDEVARKLNYPLAATIPFEDAQIQAVSNGVPIYLSNPESLHTRTILQLIRQFRLPTI